MPDVIQPVTVAQIHCRSPLAHSAVPSTNSGTEFAARAHLAANSVPLFVLGTALWASGLRQWIWATVTGWITSGIFAWLLTPIHYIVIGASGVIFGWITYLIVRGFLSRRWSHIILGLIIALAYGSVLLGVFPMSTGVSWQGHLGGAIGGILAAWLLFRRDRKRQRTVI